MTPAELRADLDRLGLSQADLARLCRTTPAAVSLWLADGANARAVPGYAEAVLRQHEAITTLPGLRAAERRYRWLLDQARPTFSRDEALAICGALNGIMFPDPQAVALLADEVAACERLSPSHRAMLCGRLFELSPVEAMAVVDAVEQFWSLVAAGTPAEDALAEVGLAEDALAEVGADRLDDTE